MGDGPASLCELRRVGPGDGRLVMDKSELIRLRNEIGSLPAMEGGCVTDDNIAIALVTYFESLPDCPRNDIDDSIGWSQWAVDKVNDALDRIVQHLIPSGVC